MARRAIVSGRVQGVFFRDSCRSRALELGVAGTVENLGDGTVEVVAEGVPGAVDALLAWCRQGPPHAVVTDVAVRDEEVRGPEGFRVVG